jgi:hypothetical protein
MTWKTKVSKANVLLFQLQASVHGIKEKGSGLLPTPVVSDHLHNQSESIENWTKRSKEKKKQGINLHFALRHHVQMYPTPTQDSASERTKKYSQGGMPLPMAVKMFPTPSASCHMDVVAPPETVTQNNQGWSVTRVGTGTKFGAKLNDVVNKLDQEKLGGKLNPNFVEFLMGYPQNYTKIDQTE